MIRKTDKLLLHWKGKATRRPLLVRGARQVGKSYSISSFGKKHYENIVEVNFEEKPEYIDCFDNYDVKEIVKKISILSNSAIIPGKTLLFLDEIQDCPRAIAALRYFHEKLPELHVIGAGSLMEFALNSEGFRMPVGRVESLFMRPLTFEEFLEVSGNHKFKEWIEELELGDAMPDAFKNKLETLLKTYLVLGGMPEVLKAYLKGVDMEELKNLQSGLVQTYKADFAKYASTSKHKYLSEVFSSAPGMVGSRYKYSNVNPHYQSRDLKNALSLLADARCLSIIRHSGGNGIPLEAEANNKKIKILYLDVGLMQRALGLDANIMMKEDVLAVNSGSVAEQFTGQELLAAGESYEENKLFFWARDKKGSNAEVDYLISMGNKVLPVEVKAGKTGTLKSMRLFLNERPESGPGIRFSMHEFSFHQGILSIPLYLAGQYKRLVESVI